MAKSLNTFVKSKMNRDLDARLVPKGEYREGRNINISKSEGSDVGALENIRGNEEIIKDIGELSKRKPDYWTLIISKQTSNNGTGKG